MDGATFDSNFVTFITGGHCRFWSINPYALCDFRCSYCITGVQGLSAPTIESKELAVSTLAATLEQIPGDQPIIVGGISDAYPHAEQACEVTRSILELLIAKRRRFAIITKSTLVARDAALLAGYADSRVEFSFSTLDDSVAALYEIDAPRPSSRLAVLEEFLAQGIDVKVSLRPWIPEISDIQSFLDRVPPAVPIGLERLKIVRASRTFSVAGMTFTQAQIDARYRQERKKNRHNPRLKWSFDKRFSHQPTSDEHPIDIICRENEGVPRPSSIYRMSVVE